jgi:ABC-2 type transport system ATP-binding protein
LISGDRSIHVERLSRSFNELKAVDEVDLEVPSGEVFGFLGPNGAGKTTLVRMLTTILAPTSGRATVAGFDVVKDANSVRNAIGVALQDVGLDPIMTGGELLTLHARLFGASGSEADDIATRLLRTVGLDDVDPKKQVKQYSGGMKRRLDLAMALVHEPSVLFLDEPTTGLDPVSRTDIWNEVRRLNTEQGVTIFLTTQYLEEADRLADRVAIINRGRIVALGPPDELKKEIGEEVVSLTFETGELAEKAQSVLAPLAPVIQRSGRELALYLAAAAPVIPELVRSLDQASVPLSGLTLSRPTLDDVFLRATGERIEVAE